MKAEIVFIPNRKMQYWWTENTSFGEIGLVAFTDSEQWKSASLRYVIVHLTGRDGNTNSRLDMSGVATLLTASYNGLLSICQGAPE